MYKVSSDKKQAALHRGRLSDWLNGEERLSVEDRFSQMREGVKILQERKRTATDEERRQIGIELRDLESKIAEYKKAFALVTRVERGIEARFIVAAREMLPRATYEAIHAEARRSLEQMKAELENQPAPSSRFKFRPVNKRFSG